MILSLISPSIPHALALILLLLPPAPDRARPADANPRVVATFECIGLYWDRPASAYGCRVCYRAAGAEGWRDRYPLVYDARERQYCGSLVGLAADTTYDIRLEAGGERADMTARMWSSDFPIGKTTYLPGDARISRSPSPKGEVKAVGTGHAGRRP